MPTVLIYHEREFRALDPKGVALAEMEDAELDHEPHMIDTVVTVDGEQRTVQEHRTMTVEQYDGPTERPINLVNKPDGVTTVSIPDDEESVRPSSLMHLVEMLTERHFSGEHAYAVYSDDPKVAATLGALLDAEVLSAPRENEPAKSPKGVK